MQYPGRARDRSGGRCDRAAARDEPVSRRTSPALPGTVRLPARLESGQGSPRGQSAPRPRSDRATAAAPRARARPVLRARATV
eukprot:scaffold1549_cov350-Prasinococcus_capsulatus_cf.AAC.10